MASQDNPNKGRGLVLGRGRGIIKRPTEDLSLRRPDVQGAGAAEPKPTQALPLRVPAEGPKPIQVIPSQIPTEEPTPPFARSDSSSTGLSSVGSSSGLQTRKCLGRGQKLSLARASAAKSEEAPRAIRSSEEAPRAIRSSEVEAIASTSSGIAKLDLEASTAVAEKEPAFFRGASGTQATFVSNHIPVVVKEGYSVYEYHTTFIPEVDSRPMRFRIAKCLAQHVGQTRSFDGSKLFLPLKLPQDLVTYNVPHPADETNVTVTLKFVGSRKPGQSVHHFNILLRRVMNELEMVQIGRHYYNPSLSTDIRNYNLLLWPGYITSISEFEGGLMLCAETSHRVLRSETVLAVMTDIVCKHPRDYKDEISKRLIGCVVLTVYDNKNHRIDDVCWVKNPKSTFMRGDREISYIDYYREHYQMEIRDHEQPLLLNRVKKKMPNRPDEFVMISIIPELCRLTGLTDDMRSDNMLMREMASSTRLSPNQRQNELIKLIKQINNCEKAKAFLDGWGVSFIPELIKVPGRTLPEETICFRNKEVQAGKNANWSNFAVSNVVLNPVDIMNWAIIYARKDEQRAREFVGEMHGVVRNLGIRINDPKYYSLPSEDNNTLARTLQNAIIPQLQLVVVINPTPRDDRYNLIKKICCVDSPIPSQVINSRTLSNRTKLRSITQKIALQINCKLGGELWSLKIPLTGLMVCGIDTYHNVSASNKSVYGFVASLNESITRWYCDAKFQTSGQELSSHLRVSVTRAIQKYHAANHSLPKKIIFVRDGVSDGQLDCVCELELQQVKKAFEAFPEYKPEFMMIIVQKRINTKIFSQMYGRDRTELMNPPPGTIVDQTITRRYLYDFFLVSQHVTQGTVTPTHFIVVFNNIMTKTGILSPDRVQQIMYKLTHLYYNWPGTVRVPAPCQYAHKLANLVGENIKKEPHEKIMDRLFFL